MSNTLFLSPPPTSNPLDFPLYFNTYSTPQIPSSFAFNPNSHKHSNRPRSFSFTATAENHESSISTRPISQPDAVVKVPTPPWIKGPLLLQPSEVLDLSKPKPNNNPNNSGHDRSDRALIGKESGGRGKKAMRIIVQSIEKLRTTRNSEVNQNEVEGVEFGVSLEDIGGDGNSRIGTKMPWVRDERVVFRRTKKEKVATAAELSLDRMLLERLRNEARGMRKWVKVMKAGVTQAVVDEIRFIWRRSELALVKFDLPLCRNMDRAQEIVEIKTGGLVVWSKKDTLVVYRGQDYQLTLKTYACVDRGFAGGRETPSFKFNQLTLEDNITDAQAKSNEITLDRKLLEQDGEKESLADSKFLDGSQPINGSLYEREADRLLDGLGPRFTDWWMPKPLPVDADLLPEVVPGYKPPFRLSPSNGRSQLTDNELTYLRQLARSLPTHFVLGRNRKLQGLAVGILKLWEKSYIVKIAIKWGIPNTDSEKMAYELKCLTGGVVLLRNKFFIIIYRGKDFLPCGIVNLVMEREMELNIFQLHEEDARRKAAATLHATDEKPRKTSSLGTLSEFQIMQLGFGDLKDENRETELQLQAEKEKVEKDLRNQERKLFILKMKIERSVKELLKLNSAWSPSEMDADQEMLTEEEIACLRKIALKMSSSLVLGRRGVFDGVIEGIYQHWKHREVVKVITMQRAFSQVIYTAKLLEAESGGVLVSIDRLKEGHAIIIYRGKNYRRPSKMVTKNLLTKRKALHRSLEMQRIGSLKYFAYQRQRSIFDLELKLVDLHKRIQGEPKDLENVSQ